MRICRICSACQTFHSLGEPSLALLAQLGTLHEGGLHASSSRLEITRIKHLQLNSALADQGLTYLNIPTLLCPFLQGLVEASTLVLVAHTPMCPEAIPLTIPTPSCSKRLLQNC
jgi:hypothetical protein